MVPSLHHSSNQHPSSTCGLAPHFYTTAQPSPGTTPPQPTGSFPSPNAFPAFPIKLKEKQNFHFEQFNLFPIEFPDFPLRLIYGIMTSLKLVKLLQLKCQIHYDNIEVTFCFNEYMSSTQLIIINTSPTN